MELITLQNVTKKFPGVTALENLDLTIQPGEIHALMGENGAGKSSLIKVLTGVYQPDSGQILVRGSAVHPKTPLDAIRFGISTVYQEVNLAPNLTVAENIALGREPRGPLGIKWKELRKKAVKALARVGLDIDPDQELRGCSLAVQQMIAIARALDINCHTLILDEPTSSLDRAEVDQLFDLMRSLRNEGMAIVFVTHFLDQVYAISDRITVMRAGRKVGTWPVAELPGLELITQMLGKDPADLERSEEREYREQEQGQPLISASGLIRKNSVEGVTFELRKSEVLGFAGLLGSGRTETLRMLFGLDRPDGGTLRVGPDPANKLTPRQAIRKGFAFCSEDRKLEGILPELTVRENLILALQAKQGWLRKISAARQKTLTEEMVKKLDIRLPSIETPISLLSGGNQQKVLLARWLIANPAVLLLDEPTRGIDIGAKFEIMALVENLRAAGMSFVFVSSELPELVKTCDSILVFRDRKMIGKLVGQEMSEQAIIGAIAEVSA